MEGLMIPPTSRPAKRDLDEALELLRRQRQELWDRVERSERRAERLTKVIEFLEASRR